MSMRVNKTKITILHTNNYITNKKLTNNIKNVITLKTKVLEGSDQSHVPNHDYTVNQKWVFPNTPHLQMNC